MSEKRGKRRTDYKRVRITLTPAHIEALRAEESATGLPAYAVFADIENAPPGFSYQLVMRWLSGKVNNASPQHYEFALATWRAHRGRGRVTITPEMRAELNEAIRRITAPLRVVIEGPQPDGCALMLSRVHGWQKGPTKTANAVEWEFLMERLAKYKSRDAPQTSSPNDDNGGARVRVASGRIRLTEEMLDALRHEQERTGVGIYRLMAGARDAPANLHTTTVHFWLTGRIVTARPDQYDYILNRWRALPDDAVVTITTKKRAQLRSAFDQAGISPVTLRKRLPAKLEPPSANTIANWLSGDVTTIKKSHWELVMGALAEYKPHRSPLPEGSKPKTPQPPRKVQWGNRYAGADYVEITDEIVARLRSERDRTGIDHNKLFRLKPEPLNCTNARTVHSWITGRIRRAERSALDAVFAAYGSLPNYSPLKSISTEDRRKFSGHLRISGANLDELAEALSTQPELSDVTAAVLRGIRSGTIRQLPEAQWNKLLGALSAVPALERPLNTRSRIPVLARHGVSRRTDYVDLTPEMLAELEAELGRTGVKIRALSGLAGGGQMISPNGISDWRTRRVKAIAPEVWGAVMTALHALPDK